MTRALVICGLHREAVRAASPNVITIVSGGSRAALEDRLSAIDPTSIDVVVSFGLAGGLDPALTVGDLLLPEFVVARGLPSSKDRSLPEKGAPQNAGSYPTSPELRATWAETAAMLGITVASRGGIAGIDAPVTTVAAKAALRAATEAIAVDMESHIAAAWAARHGIPFGILRVVSDAADDTIPPAAIAALRDDGGIDAGAAVRSIVRRPSQIPSLIRVARDGARAFRTLGRAAACLSSRR